MSPRYGNITQGPASRIQYKIGAKAHRRDRCSVRGQNECCVIGHERLRQSSVRSRSHFVPLGEGVCVPGLGATFSAAKTRVGPGTVGFPFQADPVPSIENRSDLAVRRPHRDFRIIDSQGAVVCANPIRIVEVPAIGALKRVAGAVHFVNIAALRTRLRGVGRVDLHVTGTSRRRLELKPFYHCPSHPQRDLALQVWRLGRPPHVELLGHDH